MGRWPRACRDVTLSRFPSAVLQDADTGAIMQCIVDRLHQWQTAGSPGDDSSSVASDGGSGGGGSVAGHSGGDDATDSDPAFEAWLCTALQAAIYITPKRLRRLRHSHRPAVLARLAQGADDRRSTNASGAASEDSGSAS